MSHNNHSIRLTKNLLSFTLLLAGLASLSVTGQPSSQSPAATCISAPAGLIAWLRGEGNANDASTGNNNGTLQGVTFAPGKVGQAFNFPEGGNGYVKISSQIYSLSGSGGTVDLWFMQTGSGRLMIGSYGGSVQQPEPKRAPTLYVTKSGTFGWEFGSLHDQDTGQIIKLNLWYHAALTYDSSFVVKVYLNGKQVGSGISVNPGGLLNEVDIGHYPNSNYFFTGLIDEVQIYNRALTADEIHSIYNADSAGVCPPPLRASISGYVKDVNGKVISGETVRLGTQSNNNLDTRMTDSNGQYSFGNLPTGIEYTVSVSDNGVYPQSQTFTLLGDVSASDFVQNTPSYTVQGYVYDSSGHPISGASVVISAKDLLSTTVRTISDGSYTSPSLPRNVTFTFTPQPFTTSGETDVTFSPQKIMFSEVCIPSPDPQNPITCKFSNYLNVNFIGQKNAAPNITSISPSSAQAGGSEIGMTLTINGIGFIDGSVVQFGSDTRPANFISATQLTAYISATDLQQAGIYPVTVINPQPGGGPSTAMTFTVTGPTAATSAISGQVTISNGTPVSGTMITLTGGNRLIRAITDERGFYRIEGLDAGEFYTLTPSRANYTFGPVDRGFSLVADKTDVVFTAMPITPNANPLGTPEYFVRQQYLDFLGREPEQGGLDYWAAQIRGCGDDQTCALRRRVAVSAAYFTSQEFQETGYFVYLFHKASYGQRPTYTQFIEDRGRVIGGTDLEASKQAFAEAWVQRADFLAKYPLSLTGTQFIDAVLRTVRQGSGVDLSSQRQALINDYNANGSRARILRQVVGNGSLRAGEYDAAFVLMQYFGYLRRDPDAGGYDFWLRVMNGLDPGAFQGMTCAFITSSEYQQRFSPVITYSNGDCGRATP